MTLDQFITEIENTFANYSETGDIDRVSIKTWVIQCLREMGKNICEKREAIAEVKNSQASLPDSFKSLILALKLQPDKYTIFGDKKQAEESYIYRQTIEQPAYFDWVTNEYVSTCKSKIITEKIVMNNQDVELYYKPEYLSVVKGFKKDSFDVDCLNLHPSIREAYPHQISINNRTMQTNFREGKVYIQYNSLPVDEDGEIIIPEYTTSDLVKYIENYCKVKIAENLILNNKNPSGITQLVSMWMQQMIPLRNAAKSEVSFANLPKNWHVNYRKRLQLEVDNYNLPRF